MKSRVSVFRAALLGTVIALPTMSLAGPATPTCADLATNPAWGLAGNPAITGLTATIAPVAPGVPPFVPPTTVAYCKVNFTDVTLVGPEFGYLPGQTSKFRIQIGLPLNANDGGSGGVQGAWNGKIRTLGNGGFAGQVVATTAATNLGYIGTGSDSGHNSSNTHPVPWPGGPQPTVQTYPDESSAAFATNADGSVNFGRIDDYAYRSEHHANLWAQRIGKTYYGMKHTRNYYTGCSDGGREGHELAQRFGEDFDGIVALSPAVGHSLQQMVAGFGNYMTNQELGKPGFNTAKFQDVNARALAACDALDGITDGLIQEHRACHYNATAAICGAPGASADPTKCLTPTEASIVNRIWDGPRNPDGSRFWYGWEKGQAGLLGVTSDVTGFPDFFGEQLSRYWVHKNPFMDWRTITEAQFLTETDNLVKAISPYLAGDNPDMKRLKKHGGKMITAFGNADQVIPPDGFINYVQRVMAHEGGAAEMQEFYRFYIFPGATHCGGSGMDIEQLFTNLVNWVEHGNKPDYIVAQVNPTRTRKVCMYPNTSVYNGQGSTDDENNFFCQKNKKDPFFETASEHTVGPHKGTHDIEDLPGTDDDDHHHHDRDRDS